MLKKIKRACFKGYCFEVELADTFVKKLIGLMFRSRLEQNKGMLFLFKREKMISVWMLNTRIPLDIIWIGADKKIVHVERDVKPCKRFFCSVICPSKRALYLLEVNAGVSDELGIREGLTFQLK